MTSVEMLLVEKLLKQHFGPIVSEVGKLCLEAGAAPLRLIHFKSKYNYGHVKKALAVLIQHHFLTYKSTARGSTVYSVCMDNIILLIRYPKYVYIAKLLYSDIGEHIIEEILKEGSLTLTETIKRVVAVLSALVQEVPGNLIRNVHQVFVKLVETRFLKRHINVNHKTVEDRLSESRKDGEEEDEEDLYVIPKIDLNTLINVSANSEGQPAKRLKTCTDENEVDGGIYWKVNFDRFNQYLRDQLLVEAIRTLLFDERAGQIVRILLQLSETRTHHLAAITTPISNHEIIEAAIKENVVKTASSLESYLHVLNEDMNNRFIFKSESNAGGGLYSVNILKCLEKLVISSVASVIESRFGSKCARIFRLILSKKYLQQKQIEEIGMIPSKDAKELTYKLLENGFIKTLQYPRQPDYAPSRTFFVFTVDLESLVRNLIQTSYFSIFNAISRREFELESPKNKLILERKQFIDAFIANLQLQGSTPETEKQILDLNNSFTVHDKNLLNNLKHIKTKLELSEIQIDETLILFQIWLVMFKTK